MKKVILLGLMAIMMFMSQETMAQYAFRKNSVEFDDINLIDFEQLEKFRIRSSVEVKANVED